MRKLVYTSRPLTGAFSDGLLVNMKVLENSSSLDLLSSLKTEKGKDHLESLVGIKIASQIDPFSNFYTNVARNMNSWKEVYDAIDVSSLKAYDCFHIFGGLHFPQSNLTRFSKRASIFPHDRGQLKFKQTAIHLVNIMAIHKAHVSYGIPLHEFSYDCDELCSGMFNVLQRKDIYYLYHIYDMPQYGMRRLDSLQYYLSNQSSVEFEKCFDLTFGYTVYDYGNRSNHIKFINEFASKFKNKNILVKNNITGEDNSVDRNTYLDLISRSDYTLVIPSYDPNCFSLYRFIESIHNNCLPLIHPECRIDQVEDSFGVKLGFLKRTEPFSESERKGTLEYLKSKFLRFERTFGTLEN